ncbi:MAG: nuclear transport factor 2 family protein [Terriglobales bacterium]
MKKLGDFAISMFTAVLILGVGLLPAWGQGENPPADTKAVGQTSGHGVTLVEQSIPGNVEQEIRTLHDQGRQAALKGDAGFFEKHLAAGYFGIGGDGRLRTKAEAVQDFKSGGVKYESIDERDIKVNTYGNMIANGKPIDGDYRATFVYVKQGGDWREVAFQSTPVAPEGR